MSIAHNIRQIRNTIPKGVQMVCVSKYHTEEDIVYAYHCGERIFAESRAQELQRKAQNLPKDIIWHFIGHLQTNKVKIVCQYATCIQSVDSLKLLKSIEKTVCTLSSEYSENSEYSDYSERTIDVLLEVHVAKEETKTGLTPAELNELLDEGSWRKMQHVRIKGLMGMATNTDNTQLIREEFHQLKSIFEQVKQTYFSNDTDFNILSMGMSDDYKIALEEGANMVRIGSSIFKNQDTE